MLQQLFNRLKPCQLCLKVELQANNSVNVENFAIPSPHSKHSDPTDAGQGVGMKPF